MNLILTKMYYKKNIFQAKNNIYGFEPRTETKPFPFLKLLLICS